MTVAMPIRGWIDFSKVGKSLLQDPEAEIPF